MEVYHEYDKFNETGKTSGTIKEHANFIMVAGTVDLLFHMEHYLFPTVPSNHLSKLAKRLNKVAPEMTKLRVVPSGFDFSNMLGVSNDMVNMENGKKKLMFSKNIIADIKGKVVEGLG